MAEAIIEYDGVTFQVIYEYTPSEDAVFDLESPSCGPGCDSSAEIIAIYVGGIDMLEMLSESTIQAIYDKLLASLEN